MECCIKELLEIKQSGNGSKKKQSYRTLLDTDLQDNDFKGHTIARAKHQTDVQSAVDKFVDAIIDNLSKR